MADTEQFLWEANFSEAEKYFSRLRHKIRTQWDDYVEIDDLVLDKQGVGAIKHVDIRLKVAGKGCVRLQIYSHGVDLKIQRHPDNQHCAGENNDGRTTFVSDVDAFIHQLNIFGEANKCVSFTKYLERGHALWDEHFKSHVETVALVQSQGTASSAVDEDITLGNTSQHHLILRSPTRMLKEASYVEYKDVPREKKYAFLDSVPLFHKILTNVMGGRFITKEAQQQKDEFVDSMTVVEYKKGDLIYKQGEVASAFFIIMEGDVVIGAHEENFLKPGEKVTVSKDLIFCNVRIPKGSLAIVDNFEAGREFPYTIRILHNSYRGRATANELDPVAGFPREDYVAALKKGEYFGEQAEVKGSIRSATARAVSDTLKLLRLPKEKFRHFDLGQKLQFVRRKAVIGNIDQIQQAEFLLGDKKSDQVIEFIKCGIRNNFNLNQFLKLSDTQLENLARAAVPKRCNNGEIVIKQGDQIADRFFIVQSGEFLFERDDRAVGVPATTGNSFGELSLLYNAPRAATVVCSQPHSLLWTISRSAFRREVIADSQDSKVNEYLKILSRMEIFHVLLSDEKQRLAESMVELSFKKGEVITKEGDKAELFYVLKSGILHFFQGDPQPGGVNTIASSPKKPYWFGERALLRNEPRRMTVVSGEEDTRLLCVTKAHFDMILAPNLDLLRDIGFSSMETPENAKSVDDGDLTASKGEGGEDKEKENPEPRSAEYNTHCVFDQKAVVRKPIEFSDLNKIGLLGCGGFGAVTLQQHKRTHATYALKALSKGYLVRMKMQKSVLREKEILSICNSQFVIRLHATFKDDDNLYFLLEPALGGELFAVYHKYKFHGSIPKAKFYAASVVFAFEHLHERSVVYRDLKPENLLLDARGFCKLTDMGLAKIVTGKTYTTCGTPDYFAPEIVMMSGMTRAVDWWTLGVLIHEFLSGHAPFEAADQMEIYNKISQGVKAADFSAYKYRDPAAVELVKAMLQKDPNERLPMKGLRRLREHPWFQNFDFQSLFMFLMRPPHLPQVKSVTDLSNFRAHEGDLPPQMEYEDKGDDWDKDF